MKRLLQSLALAIASLLITLLIQEASVRLFIPPSRWLFLDATRDWQIDRGVGWTHKPNVDVTSQTAFGWVRFRTNADGLVPFDATHEKPAGTIRIMIFGDSMTIGRNLSQELIYSARLAQGLRERGIAVDVVNAGVQGHSTDQALLLMKRWLPVYHPDVVLYGSTLNDYAGNQVDHAYGQAKPMYRVDASGELVLAPPHVEAEIRDSGGFRSLLQRSALYRLIQPGIAILRSRMFGVQQRILHGTEQALYITGDPSIDAIDWKLYEALVAEMDATARANGAHFLFFAHPEVGEVWDPYIAAVCRKLAVPRSAYDPYVMQRHLVSIAEQRHIDFVPTIDTFRHVQERGPFHLLPWDAHMNANGHALLAELLTQKIVDRLPRWGVPEHVTAVSASSEPAPHSP